MQVSARSRGLAAVTALFAIGAALGCQAKAETRKEAAVQRVHVDTIDVGEQAMPKSLALTGTLRGQRQTDLAANAVGRVIETFVERGMEVKKGDLLARLDVRAASLTAQEAAAQAALARTQRDTAKRECDRYRSLLAQGAISQAEFDRIADQCESSPLSVQAAEARAQSAAQVVGDGQIRAPFGGVVAERFVEAGQYVRQDTKIVSLVSVEVLRLELTVPEAHLAAVKQGGALTFTVPAFPSRTFKGTVKFVGATVRETTRDLVAEAEVENTDRSLRPGMFAAVSLLAGDAKVAVLPKTALVMKDGNAHVFAVVDRRLEERVVQTDVEKDGVVAVVRGVRAGDKVVAKPSDALQNGQAVE